mmetsp:Transcript_11381/g.25507  ORF Transcript_11381/g.25507 Transcript_11381/m.25507 type:complete len:232 (-) Transcript_11381:200-895(-)
MLPALGGRDRASRSAAQGSTGGLCTGRSALGGCRPSVKAKAGKVMGPSIQTPSSPSRSICWAFFGWPPRPCGTAEATGSWLIHPAVDAMEAAGGDPTRGLRRGPSPAPETVRGLLRAAPAAAPDPETTGLLDRVCGETAGLVRAAVRPVKGLFLGPNVGPDTSWCCRPRSRADGSGLGSRGLGSRGVLRDGVGPERATSGRCDEPLAGALLRGALLAPGVRRLGGDMLPCS